MGKALILILTIFLSGCQSVHCKKMLTNSDCIHDGWCDVVGFGRSNSHTYTIVDYKKELNCK